MEIKPVILIGGGFSVREGIARGLWEQIKDKNVELWSLNFAYKFMPMLPTRQCWVDITFFRQNMKELEELSKKGVKMCTKENQRYSLLKDVITYKPSRSPKEYAEHPKSAFIGTMGLCGLFSLSLAVNEDYNPIYLLGYDFGAPNVNDTITHFYQDKEMMKDKNVISGGLGRTSVYLDQNSVPKRRVLDFNVFVQRPHKIYNVSLRSHISFFPKLGWNEFYEKLQEHK